MNFCFTADQQDLIDAAKDFFDGENTFERMRSIAKGQKVESLWPQFVELGLLGVMAHEKDGGMGQPLVLMAAIAEAAGYSGLPDPFIEVAGITIPLSASPEKLITGSSQLAVLSELRKYIDHNLGDGTAVKSIDPLRKLVKALLMFSFFNKKEEIEEDKASQPRMAIIVTPIESIERTRRAIAQYYESEGRKNPFYPDQDRGRDV